MNKLEFANRLHEKAVAAAARFKKSEIELIEVLEEVDRHKTFYLLKYPSLFKYAVMGLGLSEPVAYIYIRVARKTLQVPALKTEIRNDKISVAKAVKIASVMTKENQAEWLSAARTCSKRELERRVALACPQEAIPEKIKFTSQDGKSVRIQLRMGVSEKLMLQLRRAQDVLSQKRRKSVSLEELLEEVVPLYLHKEDPIEIAKRQDIRGKLVLGRVLGAPASQGREPLGAALRHRVSLRHEAQCAYQDERGNRCPNRRFLDVHHIVRVADGGGNELDNLTLLCSGHHKMVHAQEP